MKGMRKATTLRVVQHQRIARRLTRIENLARTILAELERAHYPKALTGAWTHLIQPHGVVASLRADLAERASKEHGADQDPYTVKVSGNGARPDLPQGCGEAVA